ncbi:hypothetical protein PSC71_16265 [Devosia sp. J2-20]|jgi:hypothetical protein|uniref:Uncharacterized protein n=1 Tax=Devosia litorisediminis TaxID=2829817 RepID=A0A942I517_9HYPH|nr:MULTISPECIES: hypothetical protein [Devosia]MBS3848166.1 hypothetical protein [Devosia litorisediminis]MCZ4345320.1 hypothetical protein [Devosia neptuniae]WDQ98735.1 hypothetical protein PSC71_16265 [Devosia sp. J2-20]|tara:strand:+ start:3758 stop:4027 length:270 start_codon:yes stop_codon:yes gene_type:complete
MSERTALTELANFVGRSSLLNEDMAARNRVLAGITDRMMPRKRGVGDLLGVVMAMSARTRRMVQDPVNVDIDVFAPGGARALKLNVGDR